MDRYAILLDGEYVKKVIRGRNRRGPVTCEDIETEVRRIKGQPQLSAYELYRVFYYTANPLSGKSKNPITKQETDFSQTPQYRENMSLLDKLDNLQDFAVRRGILALQGWKIGNAAKRELLSGRKNQVCGADLEANINQKGVDMRIGLDIASLALKRLVSTIVLVTGDADLVPAMKFARREGLRIFLDFLEQRSIRPELKIHADIVLP